MKKYLYIWAIWLLVFSIPLITYWGLPQILSDKEALSWFIRQAVFSCLITMIILEIELSVLTTSIATVEIMVMFLQIFAAWGYRFEESPLVYFYDNYEIYQNCANIVEIIILLLAFPGGLQLVKNQSGIYNRFPVLRRYLVNRDTNNRRRGEDCDFLKEKSCH